MATPGVSETKEETDGYDDSPELVGSEATVATGRYKDGEQFCIIDRWKDSPDPHRRLREEWTGTTYFVERSAEMKFE